MRRSHRPQLPDFKTSNILKPVIFLQNRHSGLQPGLLKENETQHVSSCWSSVFQRHQSVIKNFILAKNIFGRITQNAGIPQFEFKIRAMKNISVSTQFFPAKQYNR